MAKKARRRREQLKRSKPRLCGVREFPDDLPCKKPAGHSGGHLAIYRRSAEQILADELRKLRLALSTPGGLVAKAERSERRQSISASQAARGGNGSAPGSRARRKETWAAFFKNWPPDMMVTPDGKPMTDDWRVEQFRKEYGITVVRTTMGRQRGAALKRLHSVQRPA